MCWCLGFPITPSEYASLAAQTVIGQVLEAVAPLTEDARVQALSVTMTAFMEAWMEHILKQNIKFRYVYGRGHRTQLIIPEGRGISCIEVQLVTVDLQQGGPCFNSGSFCMEWKCSPSA